MVIKDSSNSKYQYLLFFCGIIITPLTAFIIFAYADAIFLRLGLFDKAPTYDFIPKDDDRLFLKDGARDIIGDQSSLQYANSFDYSKKQSNPLTSSRLDTSS